MQFQVLKQCHRQERESHGSKKEKWWSDCNA